MDLYFNFPSIFCDLFARQKISFAIFPGWISDHSGSSSHNQKKLVPLFHNMERIQEGNEVPQLQRIRRRINSPIEFLTSLVIEIKKFFMGKLVEKSSGFEFLLEMHNGESR